MATIPPITRPAFTAIERSLKNRLFITRFVLVAGIAMYLAAALYRLNVFPRVGEDEPWIAAAPYKLATDGVLGSDLFTGYYGMERHHLQHMPVYPVIEAGIFRVFGVGVIQMRLLSVACGLALLIAVFAVGSQLGDARIGALAVVLMVTLRITASTETMATGILLLDRARINRYDIAVAVFGLWALWSFNRAERDRRGRWYAVSGALAGLSSLSHLIGAFWILVLTSLLLLRRRQRAVQSRPLWLLFAGFIAVWMPWVLFVAPEWRDFIGQMRPVRDRFEVFRPSFYWVNLLRGGGPLSLDWAWDTVRTLPPARVGTWTMLMGVFLGGWRMLRDVWRRRATAEAVALAISASAQLILFLLLLKMKTFNYMIALWPLGALIISWVGIQLWDRSGGLIRAGMVGLALLVVFEGSLGIVRARTLAALTTPYDEYERQIANCIPPGSRVLGFQHYWLGLRQFPYRTWLLPLNEANPDFAAAPVPFDRAIERIQADVLLIDRYFEDLLRETQNPASRYHYIAMGFAAFAKRHVLEQRCTVVSATYGDMQVVLNRGFR